MCVLKIIHETRKEEALDMPTINQLVRKGRKSKGSKSNSPALNFGYTVTRKYKQTILLLKNAGLQLVSVQ